MNNEFLKIFDSENHRRLFKQLMITEILEVLNPYDECNCSIFDNFPYDAIGLKIL